MRNLLPCGRWDIYRLLNHILEVETVEIDPCQNPNCTNGGCMTNASSCIWWYQSGLLWKIDCTTIVFVISHGKNQIEKCYLYICRTSWFRCHPRVMCFLRGEIHWRVLLLLWLDYFKVPIVRFYIASTECLEHEQEKDSEWKFEPSSTRRWHKPITFISYVQS